jgi:hypothetical protein
MVERRREVAKRVRSRRIFEIPRLVKIGEEGGAGLCGRGRCRSL